MKNNNMRKIIKYIVICILLFMVILSINYINIKYDLVEDLITINGVIFMLGMPFYYFVQYFKEKIKKKKIEDSIIIKNIDFKYYRDIIEEYSPAVLSFILNGTEFKKDFRASIIYLINKGYLEIQKDKIVRTNKDCIGLSKDLQLLCNSDINHLIASKDVYFIRDSDYELERNQFYEIREKWQKLIENDAIEKGLVVERENKLSKIWIAIIILENLIAITTINMGLLLSCNLIAFILGVLRNVAFRKNKWIKTQKGYELYTKIIGLKNYIKDYSMISESEIKEISIWEDYLIYAIVLNGTTKLNNKAKKYYKNINNKVED